MRSRARLLAAALAATSCAPEGSDAAGALEARELLPAGVRRLSAWEYDRAVSDLLGREERPSERLVPELDQNGFTNNAEGAIDPLLAALLRDAALELASSAVRDRLLELVPCAEAADAACAERFVTELGERAFRRPLSGEERERFLGVFRAGAEGGTFADGVELTLSTWLQAPSFLYLTTLGAPDARGPAVVLTEHELAAELAFTITGAPPDVELRAAAGRGELRSARARGEQAWRLLGESTTRFQYRRFVAEWLGVTAPSAELEAFVDRVLIERGGSLAAFLTGGLGPGRVGVLDDASFLAAHARLTDTAPVQRGLAVLRRVLCRDVPRPSEIDREVTFPPVDPALTNRQRFAAHASDPACAACHDSIDPVGFAFESFDPLGRPRTEEAGRPVDTRGQVTLGGAVVEFSDSAELARALAADPESERCLARQVLRFSTGMADAAAEAAFVERAGALEAGARASLVGLFLAYVESDAFARRRLR